MSNSFKSNVHETFKKHGLDDEKLESVMTDLFEDFKTHLLHESKLVDGIKESLDRDKRMNDMFK